jgi:hypothetical protein
MKQPELCPVSGKPLPDDLAGYQCVMDGSIHEGDLLIDRDTKDRQWAICDRTGHEELASFLNDGYNVYRKIACPKAGDFDKGWKQSILEECDMRIKELEHRAEEAKTDDGNKPPLSMLPWEALNEVAMVQKYGADKYQDFHNYRKGMKVSRHISCAIRHLAKYMLGEDKDQESGCSHLAHAACRILFVLQNLAEKTAIDDRYKPKSK